MEAKILENNKQLTTNVTDELFDSIMNGDNVSPEKIIELQKLAEENNLEAQYHLAFCYQNEKGVEENQEEAFKLYTSAANAGHVPSLFQLGLCYENGEGCYINDQKAIEYYTLAANKGNVDALYCLAVCYENGTLDEQDHQKAFKYYKLAADAGCINSQYKVQQYIKAVSNVSSYTKNKYKTIDESLKS